MYRTVSFALAAGLALASAQARAEVKVKPVISGLNNPAGVAVQPGTGHVFVSNSGALEVVRFDPKSGKSEPVITEFPKDVYGKGPKYDIGPLGLAFLDKDTLVVGGGGQVDGSEVVQFYQVVAPGKKTSAAKTKFQVGPIGPGDDSQKGEGNFYALAVGKDAIYITSNGDDTKGWVAKIDIAGGKPGKLTPFIKTKVATNVDAPVGIAIDSHGSIVVGQMGEINVPKDSLLTYYDAHGEMKLNAKTDLFDIAALAYSPSGKLYAIDFAWMDAAQGGLYRLDTKVDGDKLEVKAEKVVSLDKATALAFTPDGKLYVTVFGTAKEGAKEAPGQLLLLEGEF